MSDLTDVQLDALREIGNIGAGNAATALSQLINQQVQIDVPSARVVSLADVPFIVGGPEKFTYSVYLPVIGEASGTMLALFAKESALLLVGYLLGEGQKEEDFGTELSQSAIKEVGSILCGSYLSAITQVISLQMLASVPALAGDMVGAILDFILIEIGQAMDEVLFIKSELSVTGVKLDTHLLFLPNPGAMEHILSAMGI
ncbi:MAG: chemotaxis protein CheC [Candidatus Omnitrophota bacterium]